MSAERSANVLSSTPPLDQAYARSENKTIGIKKHINIPPKRKEPTKRKLLTLSSSKIHFQEIIHVLNILVTQISNKPMITSQERGSVLILVYELEHRLLTHCVFNSQFYVFHNNTSKYIVNLLHNRGCRIRVKEKSLRNVDSNLVNVSCWIFF